MKTTAKVAVQVPLELGTISAIEEAERIIASREPSRRLPTGSNKITWSYFANRP